LPHLTSFALLDAILAMPRGKERLALCGPGFMDTTRIAAASPSLWQEIALANREALLKALAVYEKRLALMRKALEDNDGETLRAAFERASRARQSLRKI